MALAIPTTIGSIFCFSLLASCAQQASVPAATVHREANAPTSTNAEPSTNEKRGTILISEDLRKACGIAQENAYFAFDSARIDDTASKVLGQVASCLTSGPLAGRRLSVVGRADPRGDSEYNMVLGDMRASAVASALEVLGLGGDKVSSSSRGEMDATGTDEATWGADRRVDLLLN